MKKPARIFYRVSNYIAAMICSAGVAVCVGYFLYVSGFYLQGSAVYAQLYKLDVVADAIGRGSWPILYAPHWYNGYEIFRYAPSAAYYLIVMLSRICGGDIHGGICVFYGVMAFLAQMGFFLFGIRCGKKTAAFLTGLAWLFLPATFYIAILQGSFDIVMGLAFLPLAVYFVSAFVRWNDRLALLPFSLVFCLLILSHYVLAVALGIVLALWLFLYAVFSGRWGFAACMTGNLLLLYLAMGYFLYPALAGGLLTRRYVEHSSPELPVSMAVLVIAIVGLITADRQRAAGFVLTIMGILVSLAVMRPVMRLIPAVVLQKPYWYLPAVLVIFLAMLLSWERLRLPFLVLALLILAGENIPFLRSASPGGDALERDSAMISEYLLDEAAACTDNKAALLDASALGAYPHWYFACQGVDTINGWDYENSATVWNQMQLHEALADGFYDYVFDRLRLYGSDVVVILKEQLAEEGALEKLSAAGVRNGYSVRAENDKAVVWKMEAVDGRYGVISHYKNLAVGKNAAYIAYIYPSFGLGRSDCLEDYTIEELNGYEKLYLSGFTYREKEKAENMLKELSEKGTEVYIDMQYIPVNMLTGKNEFMGVYAQFVQFTEDFPILENDNGNQFKLDFKAGGYGLWDTVYVSGCEEVLKETVYDRKSHLTYLGRNNDPNVTFMGFNLIYYYLTSPNPDLGRFLDEAMGLSSEDLPKPEIVPITVEQSDGKIIVHTQRDGVNCNIAALDTLAADRIITTQENLWVVNQGDTIFTIVNAGQERGKALSILGMTGLAVLWIAVYVLLENKGNGSAGVRETAVV